MTQRAIDRFRPQPASKQSHLQGHPTAHDTPPIVANHSLESSPKVSDLKPIPTLDPSPIHVVPVDLEPIVSEPEAFEITPDEATSDKATSDKATSAPPHPFYQTLLAHAKRQMFQGARVIGVPLIWVGVAAFCGGTGFAAFNWLSTIPPIPECDHIWFFSTDADKLFCAEQAARSGTADSLQAGVKLVETWSSSHQLYAKASRLHREWSKQLLQTASRQALDDDLNGAIKLAKAIKPGNPLYREAKNSILEWEKLRDRSHLVASTVEAALKAQDWQKAETELQPRSSQISNYQRQQLNRLRERVVTERIAFNQLQQVRQLVGVPSAVAVETLGRAIQLAAQINPSSYVSAAAKLESQRWSEALVRIAETRLQRGDVTGAIAAAQWIPAQTPLTPPLQELLWVSRAEQPTDPPASNALIHAALWQQTTILAALQPIQPDSPLYAMAQANRSRLERQVQDLTQLNLASAVAQVSQISALQLAIQMAQSISLDRPYRIQAQTFIAQWRQEIERIQDRPYLVQAQKRAASHKIKDLHAAIAQASTIPLGRALRPEAQAAIFDWRQQIQTIEDKPTLDKARQFAQQKQLAKAIQVASNISTGRALYPEAQHLIGIWTATIQTAEDRPILEEARTLATQGRFGAAIDVAYQIAPERALYNEAQTAIAQWTAQIPKSQRSRRDGDEQNGWEERAGHR